MTIEVDRDWWQTLFDGVYLQTDARSVCDDGISRREVNMICDLLGAQPADRILDLCGGHGRHSLELASRGFTGCTVVDYSAFLVEHGRQHAREQGRPVEFVQADARATGLPGGSFDHVFVAGNSLGYMAEPDGDARIVGEANRLLRAGGRILIDVADGDCAAAGMAPNAWHEIGADIIVCRRRELDGRCVRAREVVLHKRDGMVRDRTYAIRLFGADDLTALLTQGGFADVVVRRGYAPHAAEGDYGFMNNRMLAVGVKS